MNGPKVVVLATASQLAPDVLLPDERWEAVKPSNFNTRTMKIKELCVYRPDFVGMFHVVASHEGALIWIKNFLP